MDGKYLNLIDMIDGGGAGRAGDTFEGGGIISALANAFAKPYGYEDRLRDRKNNTGRAIMTAVDSLRSSPRPQMRPSEPAGPSINPANAYVLTPPSAIDMPYNQSMGIEGYNMPMSQDVIDLPEISVRGNVEDSGMTPDIAYDPEFQRFVDLQNQLVVEANLEPLSMQDLQDAFIDYKQRRGQSMETSMSQLEDYLGM
jgi:hypothetical protein